MITHTFAVDTTAQQPITAQGMSAEIEIYENDQAGTGDYFVYAPYSSSDAVTRPAGSKTTFRPNGPGRSHFVTGQIVGYVKMVSGSVTFVQVEN